MTADRTPDSEFGAVVRRNVDRVLSDLGWTPLDLYTSMKLAPSSYSLMFKNASGPTSKVLDLMAQTLGCTTEELLRR